MSLDVDVVVVTYRSADHLEACLAALPAVASVTVVENASGDDSPAIARRAGATVVVNDENVGFGTAVNQGSRRGRAPFLLVLNPDAVVEPGCVEALVAALEAHTEAAAAGPRLLQPDGGEQRPWWPFPSAAASWREALGLRRLAPGPWVEPAEVPFVVGACLLLRRSAFEAVGGFDESFFLYGEETDLAKRLADEGWTSRYVPEAVCRHIGGASGGGSDAAFEHFQLGTERFVLAHAGRAALLSQRLALLVGSVLRVAALTVVGKGGSDTARHRRRIVRRLGRRLLHTPTTIPVTPRPTGRSLVVLSLEPWDEVWRRNQFFVRELLAADPGLRVLFVEPPVDVLHDLRRRLVPRGAGLRPSDHDRRLLLFQPRKVLPRLAGPLADRLLLRSLAGAERRAGLRQVTYWVNDPAYSALVRSGRPVLYDLTDDWTRADRPARVLDRLRLWDDELTEFADVVVACSADLAESHAKAKPRLIPNAVDVDHFRAPAPRPADLPHGPTAVYVGTLHEDRLDVDLVCSLADAFPELAVVLVGPDALSPASQERLAAKPSVHRLGPRPYAEVPGYLQHADVLVVPHVVTPFTASLDPIKAYECRAVGVTTVATPVAGFVDEPAPITTAPAERFVDAVREALANPASTSPQPVPSWHDRAAEFAAALLEAAQDEPWPFIVYLDHCARLSGAELALARLLDVLDVQAHVILGEDGPLVERLEATGATVEVLPMSDAAREVHRDEVHGTALPIRSLVDAVRYTFAVRRRLRELQPDLVHTNSLKSAFYGSVAARLAGVPVLVHVRDRIADDYLPGPAVRLVQLLLRVMPDAVIANSEATLATLRLPEARASVVPSPVVYDAAPAIERRSDAVSRPFTVVMVGRLAPWKGQDVFVRAFAKAFPTGDARARIVGSAMFGEDEFEAEIRDLVRSLGLDDRIELTGFVGDIEAVLVDADVLVHASIVPEPFGQVVVEGMAAGLAVIASKAGGPTEVIDDGESGLLVQPGDVAALAEALGRLERDPELRYLLGTSGLRRSADFTPAAVAAQVAACYDALS